MSWYSEHGDGAELIFLMSEKIFSSFYKMVERNTGMFLDSYKQYLVESRLAGKAKEYEFSGVADFVSMLLRTPIGKIHKEVFESLATHETRFFRDPLCFESIAKKILPELINYRRKEKSLRIFCAGVSTGQEAYSIGMIFEEFFPLLHDWDVYIQANDISAVALAKARSGIYSKTELERGLSAYLINKYFVNVGNNRFQVSHALRKKIDFIQSNLLEPSPQFIKYDLIMLRNVLIYFSQSTKDLVLTHLSRKMERPYGLLILGSTESIVSNPDFKGVRHGNICCYTHQ